jgi:hypothetical protein
MSRWKQRAAAGPSAALAIAPCAPEPRLALGLVHVALVISVCGAVFGRDILRFGGSSSAFSIELLLRVARGTLFLCGKYLAYPLALAAWILSKRKPGEISLGKCFRGTWSFWLFLCYMAMAAAVSPFAETVLSRSILFVTYALPALVALMALGLTGGTGRLRKGILVFATVNLIVLQVSGQLTKVLAGGIQEVNVTQSERLVIQSDTISTAVNFYFFGLTGFLEAFATQSGWLYRFGSLSVLLVSVGLALFTGSRGPLIAFMIAVLLLLLVQRQTLVRKLVQGISLVLALAAGCSLLPVVAPDANERLVSALAPLVPGIAPQSDDAYTMKSDERFEFYAAVLTSQPTLLGRGIGSFGEYAHRPNEYVHNLFLEAYFEMGIAGLMLLSWVLVDGLLKLLRAYLLSGDEGLLFCFIAFVFYFVEAQFSGTLLGNKGLLPFLLLAHGLAGAKHRSRIPRHFLKQKDGKHAISQSLHAISRIS